MNIEEITIKRENVEAAMNAADENTKKVLEKLFGIETHKIDDRPITERVKTFDDVLHELGEEHPYVKQYSAFLEVVYASDKNEHILAYHKLCMICEVLNEGWRPDYHDGEYRYYPLFWLYKSKKDAEKYKSSDETIVEIPYSVRALRGGGAANDGSIDGLSVACSAGAPSASGARFGSRLCLKSRELALYVGKQFSDIWLEYLFL